MAKNKKELLEVVCRDREKDVPDMRSCLRLVPKAVFQVTVRVVAPRQENILSFLESTK